MEKKQRIVILNGFNMSHGFPVIKICLERPLYQLLRQANQLDFLVSKKTQTRVRIPVWGLLETLNLNRDINGMMWQKHIGFSAKIIN